VDIRVIHVTGHYEIYVDGEFYCSVDSLAEAREEVKNWLNLTVD
jgi:hypothetical protein